MKNYTYGWKLKEQGFVEVPEEQYTGEESARRDYVNLLSEVVQKAHCGWDGVKYKVMRFNDCFREYMVLWCDGGGSRWIHITDNSLGCCLSDLGENLW